jgi:phytoene synthase
MSGVGIDRVHYGTFKRGSRTYFNSSLFFPAEVRRQVFALYGFVRAADDFVDATPQDAEGFRAFVARYRRALGGEQTGDAIIDAFVQLERRREFDPAWTEAFLHSMELDLSKRDYHTLAETLEYVYGSAEVIGLYMTRIMELDPAAEPYAQRLGRSMQYVNFIRDVAEDHALGRRYLPLADSGLLSLEESHARSRPEAFGAFLRHHLSLYKGWQKEAEEGYRYIPRRLLVPIETAADMYDWTARRIERRPLVVFERKVKPPRARILLQVLLNALGA